MYCPPQWHDNKSKLHDLDTMQQAWQKIFEKTRTQGLKYKIAFTGGELTTNKHFLPFVSWLRNNYHDHVAKMMMTTNGSASYDYYLDLFEPLDNISFSVHSEHVDESIFFNKIIRLSQNIGPEKFLQVLVMDEFWNQQRIPHYVTLLEQNQISYTINKIDYSKQTRQLPIFKGNLNLEI